MRALSLIRVHVLQFVEVLLFITSQRNNDWGAAGAKKNKKKTIISNIKIFLLLCIIFVFYNKNIFLKISTNLMIVAGETGVSGKSGSSKLSLSSSSSSCLGGAPRAAEGADSDLEQAWQE